VHDNNRRVAVVTGSRTGLGAFVAKQLVLAGYCVYGCSRTAPTWEIDGYKHFTVDVTGEAGVVNMFRCIRRESGRLDVLVNNAGAASMNHTLLVPFSTVERLVRVNFNGAFLVALDSAKLMQRARFGRIVNVSRSLTA